MVKTVDGDEICDSEAYWYIENEEEDIVCDIAKLNLSVSAGKLTFAPGKSLFDIEKNESSKYFAVEINKNSNEKKANITAELSPVKNFPYNNKTLKYNVFLSKIPVWEMELELNATANEIDLSAFKVKELKIESNASSVEVKIGNLYENVNMSIEPNASSVKIKIPKDMKCVINKDNALSSMKIYGLKKQKDGSYLSEDEIETIGAVYLTVEANVSSVEVRKY